MQVTAILSSMLPTTLFSSAVPSDEDQPPLLEQRDLEISLQRANEIANLFKGDLDFKPNATVNLTMGQLALLQRGNTQLCIRDTNMPILALAGRLSRAVNFGDDDDIVKAIGRNILPKIRKLAASEEDRGCLYTATHYRMTSYMNMRVKIKRNVKEEDGETYVGTFMSADNKPQAPETMIPYGNYLIRVDDRAFPLSIAEVVNATATIELDATRNKNGT